VNVTLTATRAVTADIADDAALGESAATAPPVFESVDDLLAHARRALSRLDTRQAVQAAAAGARFVDIRPAWQRAREGEIAGSLIVERNHLEWRLHPNSSARLPWAVAGQRWIVVCSEGYTSSLAAAALVSLGVPATDLVGGVHAWHADGLLLVPGPTPVESIVGQCDRVDAEGTSAAAQLVGPQLTDPRLTGAVRIGHRGAPH
jgi:rhodanese-related sulfurtransferase